MVGLWLREPLLGTALVAAACALAVAATAGPVHRVGTLVTGAVAVAAALGTLMTSLGTRAIERNWPEVRESIIETASTRLNRTLGDAVDLARELAVRGSEQAGASPTEAMRGLQQLIRDDEPEHGVVIFDETGRPRSWAGRHRLPAEPRTAELSTRITPFYAVMEASRQVGGRSVIGHVVLAADSAVPDRDGTVAAQFTRETGSSLEFFAPGAAPLGSDVFDYCLPSCLAAPGEPTPDTLFSVRAVPPSQGSRKLDELARGGRWVAVLVAAMLVLLIAAGGRTGRWAGALGTVVLLVYTPTGERIGLEPLFSSAVYFYGGLGPLSASAGGLLLLGGIAVVAFLQLRERVRWPFGVGALVALLLVVAAPYVMWKLGTGITPPSGEIGIAVWLSWQVMLAVVGAAVGLAAALALGRTPWRLPDWSGWAAVAAALALSLIGLFTWRPAGDWPAWYGALWVPTLWLAIQPRGRARLLIGIAIVAGSAAALLTWGEVLHGRLLFAERDARRLSGGDPVAIASLERFGSLLAEQPPPRDAATLYVRWRRSPLSQEDYPGVLAAWDPEGRRLAVLELAQLDLRPPLFAALASAARETGESVVRIVELEPGVHYVAAVPFPDGTVVTVGVAPKSQLIRPVLVGRFLRGERRLLAPYRMFLGEPVLGRSAPNGLQWRRDRWVIRGTQPLDLPRGVRHLHALVELHNLPSTLVRGMLLLILDMMVLALLGLAGDAVAGRLKVPKGLPAALRLQSYRVRLAIALAGFFVIPTLGFAAWSIGRLRTEAVRGGDLLIQQTLGDASRPAGDFVRLAPNQLSERLDDLADGLGADLLWYERGVLGATSTRVLSQMGLLGAYLPPDVFFALLVDDDVETTADAMIGGQLTRVGYRALGQARGASPVIAVPRLVDVTGLERERQDLAYGLLLATLLGFGAAVSLAALAARSLSKPVQSLRAAAVAVGRGAQLPAFDPGIPAEFVSVVDAFERMAHDVEASQAALEAARRRTVAVLSNVATGVVALDRSMRVTIANPRAEELLDWTLIPGSAVDELSGPDWQPVWSWVEQFLHRGADEAEHEFGVGGRRIRVQVASLHADPPGCVVALDDTTELTRAVRVLAWGEIARQVAHEIKNPLTPIRLGIQHLQRARRHGRADFDATLEQTGQQILAEIERLDAIARAFARFGAPPEEAVPATTSDVAAIARDAAALYSLGSGTSVSVAADGPVQALVRKDEVKEVLINLVENARDAGASRVDISVEHDGRGGVTVDVRDNGRGISEEDLTQIFEPHFSTTTSGTGLGLAICKRLVESWGGGISVTSDVGQGTTVQIQLSVPREGQSA